MRSRTSKQCQSYIEILELQPEDGLKRKAKTCSFRLLNMI